MAKVSVFSVYLWCCFVGEVCEPVTCENGADCPTAPADENILCEFGFLFCRRTVMLESHMPSSVHFIPVINIHSCLTNIQSETYFLFSQQHQDGKNQRSSVSFLIAC